MRLISWSQPALDDLRNLDEWLTREARPEIAVRMLAAIRFRAKFLEDFPHGGRPFRDGQRILRVYDTPYLIRYRVTDDAVEVIRVHHEREDWHVEP